MESATKTEIGGLSENYQKETSKKKPYHKWSTHNKQHQEQMTMQQKT